MGQRQTYKLYRLAEELNFKIAFQSTDYQEKLLYSADAHRPGLQLAGYYDYFDPSRVQILGEMEMSYLSQFPEAEQLTRLDRLFSSGIPVVVMCNDCDPSPQMLKIAEKYDVTILSTGTDTSTVLGYIIRILRREMQERLTVHGVLVEVYGLGVLIMGDSGVGKSETAIELIQRGHRLVADDAVELKPSDVDRLEGRAPELIRKYIEVRGIGIIDVERTFGVGAIRVFQDIHFIIKFEKWEDNTQYDRLGIEEQTMELLGIKVPVITVPVSPGRNLAVIVEVATMQIRQKFMGYNSGLEFTEHINKYFEEHKNDNT